MSTNSDTLFYGEHPIDMSPETFGELRESNDILDDAAALSGRMRSDGYLFLRGVLDVSTLLNARRAILELLSGEGLIDNASPLMDGVAARGARGNFRPEFATGNPAVEQLLYDGNMMEILKKILGGAVRHYDYTWLRTMFPDDPSKVTPPHCDVVYMGRGTHDLVTAWTPLGDVPREMGGLMILEDSTKQQETLGNYWEIDVDKYCENGPEAAEIEKGDKVWPDAVNGGTFDQNAVRARENIGGRWLTADYKTGDVLILSIFMLHASMNNTTDRVRISTDSRYQLASDLIDERWIGENPPAHGPDAKIGMIC
jgi:hypothetical protein